MSRFSDILRERLIKPAVEKETAHLKKELNRAKSRLEEKDFDLVSFSGYRASDTADPELTRRLATTWVSWTYANISVIAARVADIQLEMFKVTGKDSIIDVPEHPMLELLNRVNDYQTRWDLIYIWACHMLTHGEAAWYKVGVTNELSQPTELWPLNPQCLKFKFGDLSQNQLVKEYEYQLPGKPVVHFQPFEIIFFKDPHPTNPFRGYGVVEAALKDILIDYHATEYNEAFFGNFARPDGVLQTDSRLSDEVLKRTQDQWDQKFAGTKKSGKTAILEQGLNYKVVSQSAKDMDFVEQHRWIRDKIMALFKNTKVILGITEDVNRANAEASEMVWIKHNIKPKMQRLVDQLNEYLTPLYGPGFFLGFEDPLPESVELKNAEYAAAAGKWLTVNEIREELGRDPVEGGDFLYVPLTMVPVGSDPQLPAPLPTDGEGKALPNVIKMKVKRSRRNIRLLRRYAKEISNVKLRDFRQKQLEKAVAKTMRQQMVKLQQNRMKGLGDDGLLDRITQERRHQVTVKFALIFEQHVIKIVEGVINKHRETVIKNVTDSYRPAKSVETKGANDFLPDEEDFIRISIDALTPIIQALVREQGRDTLEFLDSDLPFDFNDAIRRSVRRFTRHASDSYVKDVAQKVGKVLQDGIVAGDSVQKLTQKLRTAYQGFSRSQAQRVARTETIRASNYATEQGFKQSGIVTGKQWFTAEDERVDDECAALDGKIVELDKDFKEVDDVPDFYATVSFPPLHPNCRCTISPVILNRSFKPLNKLGQTVKSGKQNVEKSIEKQVAKKTDEIKAQLKAEIEAGLESQVDAILKEIQDVAV